MTAKRRFDSLLLSVSFVALTAAAPAQDHAAADRELRHQAADWLQVAPHLPDPDTGSARLLEQAADVLRARRMPEDALDYYRYALQRGGEEANLQNRIGVTLLELNLPGQARAAFKRAIRLKPKEARQWNNLGAAEYLDNNYRAALEDYLRAVKLDKKAAVYHSNLGTAYFEVKDYESARVQFAKAMKLDHNIFHMEGVSGIEAHVLSAEDHGRFCFEMAKIAAKDHDDENVLRWLARSIEGGFDIREAMTGDDDFVPYHKDARVAAIIKNAKAIRGGQVADAHVPPSMPVLH